jgi:hypothetical protein
MVLVPDQSGDKIVSAVSYNPRFRESKALAHEALLEEMLEENVTIQMHTRESAPLGFVVPDGCDSVEFTYGTIETNPKLGCDDDRSQVVTIGEARIVGPDCDGVELIEDGSLVAGSTLLVTIPWRAASVVNLPANHLQVRVIARFFSSSDKQPSTIDSDTTDAGS